MPWPSGTSRSAARSRRSMTTTLRYGRTRWTTASFCSQHKETTALPSALRNSRARGVDLTHFTLSDFALTPLAISIETKTLQAKPIEGSVQLANWVRAHFRQLARVVERCRRRDPGFQLPILPIIYVYGNTWRVDFAHRWDGKTMIYEGMSVGDTHTVYGCYQVCAAIRRLAAWVQEDFRRWWLQATEMSTSP
ncbi:hypothetical protein VTK56DRAFT_1438 [Thermocarpiscus australiensis]